MSKKLVKSANFKKAQKTNKLNKNIESGSNPVISFKKSPDFQGFIFCCVAFCVAYFQNMRLQ